MTACHLGPRGPNPLKFCTKVVQYIPDNCSKLYLAVFQMKDIILKIVSGLGFFCSPFSRFVVTCCLAVIYFDCLRTLDRQLVNLVVYLYRTY